jgi:PAS domain S-box-containing protein
MSKTLSRPATTSMPVQQASSAVWAGLALLGAVVVAFAVTTIPGVRSSPGFDARFDARFDGWLQCGGYVVAAAMAVARPATRSARRALWAWIAASLVLRALGFLVYVLFVRTDQGPPPSPSWADAAWLASAGTLLVGLWLLSRVHAPRRSPTLVLDALVGGLTAAAVAVAVLGRALKTPSSPGRLMDLAAPNFVYPFIDVALLALAGGLLAARQARISPALAALSIGILGFAVVDCVFLYQVTEKIFRPGTVLSALSLAATALIALSAWLAEDDRERRPPEGVVGLLVPVGLTLVCVATLLYEATNRAPLGGTVLAAGGIVVALFRGYVTLTGDRTEARGVIEAKQLELLRFRALVEATTDFVAIADLRGRLVYMNPGGRRLVGLEFDADVTATQIADYLTDEGLRMWREVRLPQVVAKQHWEGESTLRDLRGGPPIPVAVSTFEIRHPGTGEPWLIATVQKDLTERVAAESAMRDLADQRQLLLGHLVAAQETERSRIAADVHDDSVQSLAAVELRLLLLRKEVQGRADDLLPAVDDVRSTVANATERLRHLLFDLESPAKLTDLPSALSEAAAFVFADGEVRWRVDCEPGVDLPTETRVVAYRIVHEAMVNARKHSAASQVVVTVRERDGGVEIEVSDDGRGFDPDRFGKRPGHLGLTGMRERAAIVGGDLDVGPATGGGTRVRFWVAKPTHAGHGDD